MASYGQSVTGREASGRYFKVVDSSDDWVDPSIPT